MANFYQAKKTKNNQQKHQVVTIEKLDHQGVGIAYYENKPMFIDGALPKETVVVQVMEQKSKFSRGKLISIQQASAQRIEPFCPHYHHCGGCNMQHLDHETQIAHKAQSLQSLLTKFAHDDVQMSESIVSQTKGYRRRARISVLFDNKQQKLLFGFRKKASKDIANITDCPVLEPELNQLLPEIKTVLSHFDNLRALGHVEVVFDGQHKAMLLRHTAPLTASENQRLVAFGRQHDLTVYWLGNEGKLECLIGEPLQCVETGNKINFLPTDFIQVNQSVNEKMVKQAVNWLAITKTDRILDLFCGLGNFSLAVARQAHTVVGVEGIQAMVDRAKENAQLNQLENIEFYQADLEQDLTRAPWAKQAFDKVLLDPARAGAAGIIDKMAELGAKQIVYVSCNPTTLARDSGSLQKQGYRLAKFAMMDMFPHTSHLESMALFIYEGKNINKANNQRGLSRKPSKKSDKKPLKLKLF
ncbi:23S rRNA (uracil(1939)-C(5))-methyltransferase RlmD [Vibrio aphrogenes]|uniref:23S rRNA (uracil(1939)-C(5))-methyltransferase RlmD n=1 Tax=Vibrio aphrogenes TaxID=1891186 RepID=UPI000B35D286|nr:23S rRNA (uracil(1939)-C(5))-methyltransferase RlmD [Vibrio aphrogenes]